MQQRCNQQITITGPTVDQPPIHPITVHLIEISQRAEHVELVDVQEIGNLSSLVVSEGRGPERSHSLTKPVRASASYTVEPEGDGARVTFELDLSSSGGMASIRERVIAGFIAQGAERDLRSLALLLRGDGEGTSS